MSHIGPAALSRRCSRASVLWRGRTDTLEQTVSVVAAQVAGR